jgi:hypothetical protein
VDSTAAAVLLCTAPHSKWQVAWSTCMTACRLLGDNWCCR